MTYLGANADKPNSNGKLPPTYADKATMENLYTMCTKATSGSKLCEDFNMRG